jgi:hypothetical protein
MKNIKIFTNGKVATLEKSINDFVLKIPDNYEIDDIKFTTSQSWDESFEKTDYTYSAMIIYS